MNKKATFFVILISLALGLIFAACTENERAKHFGGTINETLPAGKKLVNVTWKDGSVWYLTRDAREGELPETWTFQEKSAYGAVQGSIIIKEQSFEKTPTTKK